MVRLTRRGFLKASAVTISMYPLASLNDRVSATPLLEENFSLGINYPWIAYGHDFGSNGWGHDGIVTAGWTYQTFPDSQGFTDTRLCVDKAHTGNGSLCIKVQLVGGDKAKSQGEVYLDFRSHAPVGTTAPINMTNILTHCWLYLPSESAGSPSAPNGVQMFFKSKDDNSDTLYSFYSPWENIKSEWEQQWHEFIANPSGNAGFKDPQFDPAKIVAIGIKVAINPKSTAQLQGDIFLDDFILDTNPPITFDFEKLEVEQDFGILNQLGVCPIKIARVFLFANGAAAPDFESSGAVKEFDNHFFQDFDMILEIASRYNFLLMPVLLDFLWLDKPKIINGVQVGGHSDIISDLTKRQTFLDKALTPFVKKYGNDSRIFAWDVINEPEWRMLDVGADDPQNTDPVTILQMQEFVKACADTIHANTIHKVTVGSARRKWLNYWKGLGLDLYQFHWYDHFANEEPFPWSPYSELQLDKPCLIGEVPTANTAHSAKEFVNAARNGGYHGLLVWSYRANDRSSSFAGSLQDLREAVQNLEYGCVYLPAISR